MYWPNKIGRRDGDLLPVLQRSAEASKWSIRLSTKPSRPTSASVRRLTPSGADAEPPRRAVAAPAFWRWIFVSDRADDTVLRWHVLLRTDRQSIASKRSLVGKVLLPVYTSVAAAEAPGSAYTSKYTSQVYPCIHAYTSQELYGKREILINDLVLTTPLDLRDWRRPGIIAKWSRKSWISIRKWIMTVTSSVLSVSDLDEIQ